MSPTTIEKERLRSSSIQSNETLQSSIFDSDPIEQDLIETLDELENDKSCPLHKNYLLRDIYKDTKFLQFVDPLPAIPPDYDTVNPSKRINFPIFENNDIVEANEVPPSYTSTIDKLTIISLRMEFWNPNDRVANFQSKIWQNFILELNSTQLNLYHLDDSLTREIDNYFNNNIQLNGLKNPFSLNKRKETTFLSRKQVDKIIKLIEIDRKKYVNAKKLYKSYSLQFGIMGLPMDYQWRQYVKQAKFKKNKNIIELNNLGKRPSDKVLINIIDIKMQDCLRIRLEQQQMLFKFSHVEEMINWYTYLSIGINVSLDINCRQFPKFNKIIPRRRRRSQVEYYLELFNEPNKIYHNNSTNSFSSESSSSSDDLSDDISNDVENHEILNIEDEFDDDDTTKWNPMVKFTTREKYINESLRCIKPMSENKSWIGKFLIKEEIAPNFITNNLPIFYNGSNLNNFNFKIKNHYLSYKFISDDSVLKDIDTTSVAYWNEKYNTNIL